MKNIWAQGAGRAAGSKTQFSLVLSFYWGRSTPLPLLCHDWYPPAATSLSGGAKTVSKSQCSDWLTDLVYTEFTFSSILNLHFLLYWIYIFVYTEFTFTLQTFYKQQFFFAMNFSEKPRLLAFVLNKIEICYKTLQRFCFHYIPILTIINNCNRF